MTRYAHGTRRLAMASRAFAETSRVPCLPIITGSTTNGKLNSPRSPQPLRRFPRFRALQSSPLAEGYRPAPRESAPITRLAETHSTRETPHEFCTVSEGDHGFTVYPELMKRFQVGLDARSAAGVGAGDGQCGRNHSDCVYCGTCRGNASGVRELDSDGIHLRGVARDHKCRAELELTPQRRILKVLLEIDRDVRSDWSTSEDVAPAIEEREAGLGRGSRVVEPVTSSVIAPGPVFRRIVSIETGAGSDRK